MWRMVRPLQYHLFSALSRLPLRGNVPFSVLGGCPEVGRAERFFKVRLRRVFSLGLESATGAFIRLSPAGQTEPPSPSGSLFASFLPNSRKEGPVRPEHCFYDAKSYSMGQKDII